jgi:hypothetical protein
VCGPACRKTRDRELARKRRDRDRDGYREDERRRQADRRAQKRAAGSGVTGPAVTSRHAPPSTANLLDLQKKLLEDWDRQAALSRATLVKGLARIAGGSRASGGSSEGSLGPMSRMTLGAQPVGISEDS